MPISGLVVTLARDSDRALEGLRVLDAESRIEIGVRQGRKVAIVSTTDSPAEDRALWNSLESCPGIRHLDVVFIDFDREHQP